MQPFLSMMHSCNILTREQANYWVHLWSVSFDNYSNNKILFYYSFKFIHFIGRLRLISARTSLNARFILEAAKYQIKISKIMTWIRYIKGYKRACNAQCNFLVNICVIARLPNESPEFTHNLFISCLPSPNFVLFIDDGRPFQPKGNYFCCSWSIVVRREMYRYGIILFINLLILVIVKKIDSSGDIFQSVTTFIIIEWS